MLKNVRKLVLIPLEEWEKVKEKNTKEMKQVKVSGQVQEKVTPVQETVIPIPKEVNIQSKQIGKGVTLQNLKKVEIHKMLTNLNPVKQKRARLLLNYLNKDKNIKWNSKLEIVINGKLKKSSNIVNLIKHAISHKKSEIKGLHFFYNALALLNIPKFVVVNKKGNNIMKRFRDKQNPIFRPPGKLYKS